MIETGATSIFHLGATNVICIKAGQSASFTNTSRDNGFGDDKTIYFGGHPDVSTKTGYPLVVDGTYEITPKEDTEIYMIAEKVGLVVRWTTIEEVPND